MTILAISTGKNLTPIFVNESSTLRGSYKEIRPNPLPEIRAYLFIRTAFMIGLSLQTPGHSEYLSRLAFPYA